MTVFFFFFNAPETPDVYTYCNTPSQHGALPICEQGFSVKKQFPEQCRAARGLLNWTQEKLAVLAGVSRSTVRDFENGRHQLHRATEAVLVDTLEKAGIRLLSDQREVGIKPIGRAHV